MSEVNLRIDGMRCGACVNRVTQLLRSGRGVEVGEVRVGAAQVKVPEGFDIAGIIARLDEAGFAAQMER